MEITKIDILLYEIDRTTEPKNSAKKVIKSLNDMREFITKGKSMYSDDLLSFLVQIEDLAQRKNRLTVKKL